MRSPVLFWLLMIAIVLSLVVLFVRHEQGTVGGMSTDDFADLSFKLIWLVALGGSALVVFRESIGKALQILRDLGLIDHVEDAIVLTQRGLTELEPCRAG